MFKFLQRNINYVALIQAIIATSVSLYYSEIKHFPPCVLCWYQRIFMYPLVLIISVGILRRDKKLYQYVFPLAFLGFFAALYQVLLQTRILPESIAPCSIGVSCLTKFVGYFGFITIPVMSLTAFTIIIICMLISKRYNQKIK